MALTLNQALVSRSDKLDPFAVDHIMSMTMIPETDRNPGRKYRKHNTRLIERLRASSPNRDWHYCVKNRIYACWNPDGSVTQLTAAEALALLNDAPTPESK